MIDKILHISKKTIEDLKKSGHFEDIKKNTLYTYAKTKKSVVGLQKKTCSCCTWITS